MKKRTAFFGAILSLISLGQPLFIKTGVALSTSGFIFFHTEQVLSNSYNFIICGFTIKVLQNLIHV